MDSRIPYLSIVVAARNDDHGGNFKQRMQIFISGLLEQCRRFELDAELIVVEWNPAPDRPRIAQAFSWPIEGSTCTVRIIEVSPELHATIENSDRIPLHQMMAKNVGIRRARGEYVLATNIDVLFSDELVREIASRRLNEGRFYRIDRYDVPATIDVATPIDEQLAFCHDHVMRVYERNGTQSYLSNRYYRIYPPQMSLEPVGKLVHILYVIWREIGLLGYLEAMKQPAAKLRRLAKYLVSPQRDRLHTNASGDFTLMARKHWEELRGYPELAVHAMHLDSLLCYMAHYLPLDEVVLPDPMRIYHIEHEHGWTPEAARAGYDDRLGELGILRVSDELFNDYAIQMKRAKRPLLQNAEDWGMRDQTLPEIAIRYVVGERARD